MPTTRTPGAYKGGATLSEVNTRSEVGAAGATLAWEDGSGLPATQHWVTERSVAQVSYGMVSSGMGAAHLAFSSSLTSDGRWAAREESSETVVRPYRPRRARGSAWGGEVTGSRLGRYRLIERVGRGRQADVWRASPDGDGVEDVALKVLSASARDPRRRAQLKHEAERGIRLVGPSLLPTFEFGESGGAVFMAMPLVVGCTLADVLEQRKMIRDGHPAPHGSHCLALADRDSYTRDVVALLARVARAAADAHVGRVAHRDIKPGNILIRRDHAAGVYLCDFGLARDLDVATPTQLRDGAGSPLYMAPERLLKQPGCEVRSDVYALGVTLSEALTLTPPVDVPREMAPTLWTSFLAASMPRRPSSLWPEIPSALELSILRATSRDPNNRQATAAHFAEDLERFLLDPFERVERSRFWGRPRV